jgi:hypothetical protein
MQCFESLDDTKKKISVDLTNKNPQYAVISFTSKNRPSTNKLWDRMGQKGHEGKWRVGAPRCGGGWQGADQDSVHVCCIKPTCFSIYVYNLQDGMSLMSGHTCLHATVVASSSNSLAVWVSKCGMPSDSAKANMTNAFVNMCSWDIRSFLLMEGACFENVIQTALDIGFASETPLLAEDLMQSRQIVKRNTMVRFDKGVLKLQVILRNHFIDNGRVAFSIDIWMDNATHIAYNVNTLHMIDNNWVMHAHVVSCDELNKGTSHTAPMIHRNFVNNVHPFISWKEDEVMLQAAD